MDYQYSDFEPLLKALSDDTRLYIIDMLSREEMCACDILECVNISQSTLSYHMKILTESGLINSVKDGSWIRYSINNPKFEILLKFMNEVLNEKSECICKSIKSYSKNHCIKEEQND